MFIFKREKVNVVDENERVRYMIYEDLFFIDLKFLNIQKRIIVILFFFVVIQLCYCIKLLFFYSDENWIFRKSKVQEQIDNEDMK